MLDFPNNPSDGQVYTYDNSVFMWNATKGLWRLVAQNNIHSDAFVEKSGDTMTGDLGIRKTEPRVFLYPSDANKQGVIYWSESGDTVRVLSDDGSDASLYNFSPVPLADSNSVVRRTDGDARYARKQSYGIDAEGLDIRRVNRIEFGGASLDDYMRWQTGSGLFGYENGNLQWILGTGNQRTRFETVYTQTTTAGANIHVGGNGDIVRSTSLSKHKSATGRTVDGIDIISKLTPRYFTSVLEGDDPTHEMLGFYADEVADVLPAASEDGGENYDTRAIVAGLVAAVQELTTRVTELEGKVS